MNADFRERAAALKLSTPLSAVVGARVNLRQDGRFLRGCCPFHQDRTPSFWVDDATGRYGCFGCEAKGDLLDFVMATEGGSVGEALNRLECGYTPRRAIRAVVPTMQERVRTAKLAEGIWNGGTTIRGTPAERYLESRSLFVNDSTAASLRFSRLSFDGSDRLHPALLAKVQTVDKQFAGIQRTFLTEDGLKLDPRNAKRSLGNLRGNAIRIEPDGARADELYLCEGLEDGLSLTQIFGPVRAFVSAGAGMMAKMDLPPECRRVTIAADNDEAGRKAAEDAASIVRMRGMEAFILAPEKPHKDWNEFLQARGRIAPKITDEIAQVQL